MGVVQASPLLLAARGLGQFLKGLGCGVSLTLPSSWHIVGAQYVVVIAAAVSIHIQQVRG